jgi:transcriptional regulator with GAF, ATPase, and Fis domain
MRLGLPHGTGQAAEAMHKMSESTSQRLLKINCAGVNVVDHGH